MNVLATPKQQFEDVVLASKLPADWLNLYIANNYLSDDPSQRHGKRVVHPYDWKDAPFDPEREPRDDGDARARARDRADRRAR